MQSGLSTNIRSLGKTITVQYLEDLLLNTAKHRLTVVKNQQSPKMLIIAIHSEAGLQQLKKLRD